MPTYEFICEKCNESFSVTLSLYEFETLGQYRAKKKKLACPECSSTRVKQQITSFQTITSKKS